MGKLTLKQKRFVAQYAANNGNGTQAVLRVYDTDKDYVAKNIASENLTKPNVREELDRILAKDELKLSKIVDNMSSIAVATPSKGFSGADVLDANKTLLKLHGVLSDRKTVTTYNMSLDLNKLSQHELIELRNKKKQETDAILADES